MKHVQTGWNVWRKVSVVMLDKKNVGENERKGVQDSGETHNVAWFRDHGTEEKTGGRAGGNIS